MRIIRVYDPVRKPANWTDIIRHGEFVAFPSDVASGVPCDEAGRLAGAPLDAICALFDSFEEAEAWSRRTVADIPSMRLDVFDVEGRVQPPLLTVVHPSHAASLDTHLGAGRRRRALAWALIAVGVPLIVFAYLEGRNVADMDIIFPAFMGINMILIGARLLWMNLIVREREQARAARVERPPRANRPRGPQ